MSKPELTLNVERTCWCHYCGVNIQKDTRYLLIFKRAFKGTARVNICLNCLKELNDNFTEEDKLECSNIIKRVLANSIAE